MTASSGEPFSTLQRVLQEAEQGLGASWLAVAEVALALGPPTPHWVLTSDGAAPTAAPPLEWFERLRTTSEPFALARQQSASSLGSVPDDAVIIALDVSPLVSPGPDACLVIAPARAVEHARFAKVREALQRSLSERRGARLARIVLAAIEQAADPVELSDREGRLFYANRAWEHFTGYSRREALGMTAARLFRDPESTNHDPHFYRFAMSELHAGRPWLGAISGRVSEGRRVFSEAHVAPFEVPPGEAQGHVAIRRDLTQRSSRDLALLAAHREFREVLGGITDGVCVLRGELIYFTNAAFARIVARPEDCLSGLRFSELLHEDDRAQFEQTVGADVSRVRAERSDGSLRFIEVSKAGEVSFEGLPATILLVRDTTDYQMAQEELARAEKLSALGALSAGVAHEINNPLAYVALNLELLRESCDGVLTPQELEALEEAIGGVARMRDIASELHNFSGRDPPGPPSPVDVSRAISSALNLVNNEIRQRATLKRDLEPNVFALAREGQLVQVCVNLLVNAVHAIPSPSDREQIIEVTSRALGGQVEIVIRDSGVGIPRASLDRLFDPFSTSKRRGEGSGLGLAICKRIIGELGGTIRVESEVGSGTRVCVTLPEAAIPVATETIAAPRRASVRSSGLRILVIEDELPILRALEKLLHAHELVRAVDGNAALAELETNTDFDCILCDLMMPGLTGAAFYATLTARWPALASRVAIMTGGAITPDSKEFLDGFKGEVLRKPFSLEAAQHCIARLAARAEPSIAPAASVVGRTS